MSQIILPFFKEKNSPFKVLIIEKNDLLCKSLEIHLSKKEVQTSFLQDPKKLSSLLKEENFDLLLLDAEQVDLLIKIRKVYSKLELPVICLSEVDQEEEVMNSLQKGANDLVIRPVNFSLAWVRIESHILIKRLYEQIEEQRKTSFVTASMKIFLDMASTISHEIINPLTIASGRLEYLKDLIDSLVQDEQQKKGLSLEFDKVEASISRAEVVVDSMLVFGLEFEKDQPKKITFFELKKRVEAICQGLLLSEGIDLRFSGENLSFYIRKSSILQVLFNLIMNARRELKSKKDTWISIGLSSEKEGRIRLTVTDSGEGISDEIREKMFSPFFSRYKKEGCSGMGLTFSRDILELQNSQLFYNQESPHTQFVLDLPAYRD